MPIAGGILVAGSAARCLSSAAGMFRFLARLSGRRRHVRRNCGPGGGCCVGASSVQTGETWTAEMTTTTSTGTTTTTATPTTGSAVASDTREVLAGGTTTMTSLHQDRRRDCHDDSINRIQDPSWIDQNFRQNYARTADVQDARLFEITENNDDRTHVKSNRQERTRNCLFDRKNHEDLKAHSHSRESSWIIGDREFCEIRQKSTRLSLNNLDESMLHRVEEIPESQRLTRRQRLRRTSRCRSTSETTEDDREEWGTRNDYVAPIVDGHNCENEQRGTNETRRDDSNSSYCNSTTRRNKIPPYLATLLIISYTLFGIADACSSRSTPKPRPPTVTSRPNITFHMYTCPPDYAEWYCLNGATCFTVKIQESLLYNCICFDGFIGQRCEFKDLDGSYLPSRQRVMLETASIAGGATIAVFLVVIICIAAYIHCKRKQKELRTSTCVDTVDGPGRDPELRPFSNRSLMIFMAKNPNGATTCPSIEQTRMPGWNDYSPMESARMASVNEGKRGSSQ